MRKLIPVCIAAMLLIGCDSQDRTSSKELSAAQQALIEMMEDYMHRTPAEVRQGELAQAELNNYIRQSICRNTPYSVVC